MEVWQQQLEQMLDQVADYADDWESCLNMVGELPEDKNLHAYLELLVPRLKQMRREFNWTSLHNDIAGGKFWKVHNYTFKMWRFMTKKFPDNIVVTKDYIAVPSSVLSPELNEEFRQHLLP